MSQIELIAALPNWRWLPQSAKEISLTGTQLVNESDFVYQIGNVAVVGFIYTNYTSPPWMWFVISENIGIGDLVDFRKKAELIPTGTLTGVEIGNKVAMKFAKLYNFEETDEIIENCQRFYRVMRKK